MKNYFKQLLLNAKKSVEGYPKVIETAPEIRKRFKVDRRDPNFDRPLSELNKTY